MGIEVAVVGIWAALASVAALLFWNKAKAHVPPEPLSTGIKAASLPAKSGPADAVVQLEKKLAEARSDLTSSKERLATKQKELDEMKEQSKLRAKREGKKDQREQEEATAKPAGTDPRDVEIQSLRKGMASLESQLNAIKREQTQTTASSADLTQKTAEEVAAAKKTADAEFNRRRSLEEEASALRKTLDELRNAMKKADNRPDVPGTTLNLKELPTPAVQELSRYFRKGEEFERLYTVAQSQLQLEKDRYLELQRRYFAVCRELAVQAGLPANASEADFRQKAEEVIDSTADKMAERRDRQEQPRDRQPGGPSAPPAPVQLGPDGQPLPAAEGLKKKRRRRRRRKIAGEPSVVEAGAAGEAEGGDEGGDDGDEGGDDGPEDASTTPPAAGDSGASAPA